LGPIPVYISSTERRIRTIAVLMFILKSLFDSTALVHDKSSRLYYELKARVYDLLLVFIIIIIIELYHGGIIIIPSWEAAPVREIYGAHRDWEAVPSGGIVRVVGRQRLLEERRLPESRLAAAGG
jgi:hypothetical protein